MNRSILNRRRVSLGHTALLGLVGGLLLFVWGFVVHGIFDLYDPVFNAFAGETSVAETLADQANDSGIYYLPASPQDVSQDRVRAFVALALPGTGRSVGQQMIGGLIIQIVAASLVVGLIGRRVTTTYLGFVGRFALVGFVIGFSSQGFYWNWFDFPSGYAAMVILDGTIGWGLVGLAMAALAFGTRRLEDSATNFEQ